MTRVWIARALAAVALTAAAAGVHAAEWRKLLTPTELSALMAESAPRVLDIRPAEGKDSYALGHVPGAVNAPYGAWRGPKENPGALIAEPALTDLLRRSGVDRDTPVVVVHQGADDTDFGAAARVYWTLKSSGVSQIAILNGGYAAWAAAGLPVSTEAVAVAPSDIEVSFSTEWLATVADVEDAIDGDEAAVLVDARPDEFFRGLKKHDAAKEPGTLFGAVNLTHSVWFAPKSPVVSVSDEALSRAKALSDEAGDGRIVSFCNTGHWAATNWFILSEVAGVEGVALFPESTVGWSRAGLPLAPGG